MIKRIASFFKDELKHVYVRKLEQKKAELEYDIDQLEKLSDLPDVFFIKLQDLKKSHARIEHQLMSKKEAWKIE